MCTVLLTVGEEMVLGQVDAAYIHAVGDPDDPLALHAGRGSNAAGNIQSCDAEQQSKHLPISTEAEKARLQEPVLGVEDRGVFCQLQHDVDGLQIML